MIAHVGIVPVEEILPMLSGAGLVLARVWAMLRGRRRQQPST